MLKPIHWIIPLTTLCAILIAAAVVFGLNRFLAPTPVATSAEPSATAATAAAPVEISDKPIDLLLPEFQKRWWWEPKHNHFKVNADNEIVVHSPTGRGAALRGEIGGMSLDNYRFALEFIVDDAGTTGGEGNDGFPWNIQIAPHCSLVYCQVFSNGANIACWDPRKKTPFHHVSDNQCDLYKEGKWNKMEVLVDEGRCTVFLNGKRVAEGEPTIPVSGMVGIMVNYGSDATVRLRNLRLTLLEPTAAQIRELRTPAGKNWLDWVAGEKAAGRAGTLVTVPEEALPNPPTSDTESRPTAETQAGE